MDLLRALVSPCFRENVIVTSKIVSFLRSLDKFLPRNLIVFSLGNQISKWRSFEKKGLFLTYFSIFLVTREKTQNFFQHTSHLHACTYFVHTILTLFAFPSLQKLRIYHVWFLFGATPGVDSYSHHFRAFNK